MGLFKEVELTIPPKNIIKTIKTKSLNGYGVISEKINEGNTLTVKQPVQESTKPKTKISTDL